MSPDSGHYGVSSIYRDEQLRESVLKNRNLPISADGTHSRRAAGHPEGRSGSAKRPIVQLSHAREVYFTANYSKDFRARFE